MTPREKELLLFARALQVVVPGEEKQHADQRRAGQLMAAKNLKAMSGNQKVWYRAAVHMRDRTTPPYDERRGLKGRANAEWRRTRRLARQWKDSQFVSPEVRVAAEWMHNQLNEMKDGLSNAVYVFESSLYPGVIKIGWGSNVVSRVRDQAVPGEVLTIVRTYKSMTAKTQDEQEKEDFHQDDSLFWARVTVAGRTESFTALVDFSDTIAEKKGYHIHLHRIEVSK